MLAPRIHNEGGDYAGLILFAGSPRFLLDIMKDQQTAAFAFMEEGEEKTAAQAANELFNSSIDSALALSDEEAKTIFIEELGTSAYYFKDLYDNPVSVSLRNISAPFLVMHAAEDLQVDTVKDFGLYKELLADRSNVTFKLYDGLNHLFMPAKTKNINEILDEYKVKARIDGQVLRDIEDWIKAN
jgi:pimeloyl-ACP methyl ester carboxylesterase